MTAIDTHESTAAAARGRSLSRLATYWAAASGIAVALVVPVFLIARQIADPLVVAGTGEVTLGNVTGFTLLGATLGAVLAVGVSRVSRKPRRAFLTATLIALAGYAVVPFTAAASTETALWLNLFHLVVAVPVIGMFTRWMPDDRSQA